MRVALVVGAKGWRGSVASFVKVADGLRRHGHHALFLTAEGPVPERLRALGHDVTILGARKSGLREALMLHRILADREVAAIYADTPRDLRLSVYATRLRRLPIAYRYNVNARPPRGDLGDRLIARGVSSLVVLSSWVEERVSVSEPWLAARGIARIPNGFDLVRFAPDPAAGSALRRRLGIPCDRRTVLCASIFAPGKRQELLVEALRRLERPPLLMFAGGDESQATFGEAARGSGLEIRWLGRPAPEELPAIYAAADVVAQPSDIESFGNVVGEAMACGRAVVVPDAGAAPEVAGSAAVIARANDPAAWSVAIEELLADPARRTALGAAARERITAEFPIARMQDAHVELFERLTRD